MFNIRVRVSGGVTGTREALLKANGEVMVFESREAAEAEAQAYRRKMNNPKMRSAFSPDYSATVVEAEDF
jgi:hypothetical protein